MGEVIHFPPFQKETLAYIFEFPGKYPIVFRNFQNWLNAHKDSIDDDLPTIASVYYMFLESFREYTNRSDLTIDVQKMEEINTTHEHLKQYIANNIKDQSIAEINNGPLFAVFAEDIKKIQSRQYDDKELELLGKLADQTKQIAYFIDRKLSQMKK